MRAVTYSIPVPAPVQYVSFNCRWGGGGGGVRGATEDRKQGRRTEMQDQLGGFGRTCSLVSFLKES